MRAVLVIVIHVRAKSSPEMAFAKNDHAVETLAPDGPDDSLCVRILPRALRCGDNFFDTHCPESGSELFAVDPVTITKQITWCFVPRKRFGQLPSGPRRRRIRGDGEVDNLPAFMSPHDEAPEEPERDCRHHESLRRPVAVLPSVEISNASRAGTLGGASGSPSRA